MNLQAYPSRASFTLKAIGIEGTELGQIERGKQYEQYEAERARTRESGIIHNILFFKQKMKQILHAQHQKARGPRPTTGLRECSPGREAKPGTAPRQFE